MCTPSPLRRSSTRCTQRRPGSSGRCGRSAGWCTPGAIRCGTCGGLTWSTAAARPYRPRSRGPAAAGGGRSASPTRRPEMVNPGIANRPLSLRTRTAAAARDLQPGYFAFVMATGIISTGTFLFGPTWLSRALLAAASAGLVVLTALLAARVAFFRSSLVADVKAPERVFGFFTITAGLDVLGVRLAAAGHPLTAAILSGLAAAVWLVLTYGVPASLLLARSRDCVLGGVNGTWLLWVVASQSLSVAASTLVFAWPSQSGLLATAAA